MNNDKSITRLVTLKAEVMKEIDKFNSNYLENKRKFDMNILNLLHNTLLNEKSEWLTIRHQIYWSIYAIKTR